MDPDVKVEVSDDITYEIFLKLPAKSLLRFRLISKKWRDKIDSLAFANKHILTRIAVATDEPQVLPLSDKFGWRNDENTFLYDGSVIQESEDPILYFDRNLLRKSARVEAVAYGLILLKYMFGALYLCNPLAGDILRIPYPFYLEEKGGIDGYGIGVDITTNSYKIVRVSTAPGFRRKFEIAVYTLGTDSWRVISPPLTFLPVYPWKKVTVCAFGYMHWKNWDNYKNKEKGITTFNLKNEEFEVTPLPNFGKSRRRVQFELINLKGFLAIVRFLTGRGLSRHIEIWVLKDCEKKEWVREYKISCSQVYARDLHNNVVTKPPFNLWCAAEPFDIGVCNRGLFLLCGSAG